MMGLLGDEEWIACLAVRFTSDLSFLNPGALTNL